MDKAEVLELFKRYDAFLEGHFLLTSGLHSPHYFQCARILQYPEVAERLGESLGARVRDELGPERVDAVISPAMGGLIIGHELARSLGCRAIFAERQEGVMRLRRFTLATSSRVVVVEDVVTTGGSLLETARIAEEAGAEVLAVSCLVDRSSASAAGLKGLISLAKADVVNYQAVDCPLCRQGLALVKPGSRSGPGGSA